RSGSVAGRVGFVDETARQSSGRKMGLHTTGSRVFATATSVSRTLARRGGPSGSRFAGEQRIHFRAQLASEAASQRRRVAAEREKTGPWSRVDPKETERCLGSDRDCCRRIVIRRVAGALAQM